MASQTRQDQGGSDRVEASELPSTTVSRRVLPDIVQRSETAASTSVETQLASESNSLTQHRPSFTISFRIKVTNNLPPP